MAQQWGCAVSASARHASISFRSCGYMLALPQWCIFVGRCRVIIHCRHSSSSLHSCSYDCDCQRSYQQGLLQRGSRVGKRKARPPNHELLRSLTKAAFGRALLKMTARPKRPKVSGFGATASRHSSFNLLVVCGGEYAAKLLLRRHHAVATRTVNHITRNLEDSYARATANR